MKKIITLMFVTITLVSFSQPIVEGTYLPVAGTKFKQIWDTIPGGTMIPPTIGANQVWDYSAAFNTICDTFEVATKYASAGYKNQYFQNLQMSKFEGHTDTAISPSHYIYVRTPFRSPYNLSDSLYNYVKVTQKGLYALGGFNIKKSFDSTLIYTRPELLVSDSVQYGQTKVDTSRYYGYANKFYYMGSYYKVKMKGRKIKNFNCNGYGTLIAPNATYNDVLLAHSINAQSDSFYVDIANNGSYSFLATVRNSTITENYFIRNNTFGSSYLMYLAGNAPNSFIGYGWYTQPVDTGTIKGTVFTNTLATTNATIGVAYLYRENSNFAKNDILATTPLDASGNYQFNSIPYGLYRIAIRPDTTVYHNAFITYYGDATDWLQQQTQTISTFTTSANPTSTYSVGDIHLQYYQPLTGLGSISGTIGENLTLGKIAQNAIPGVGTVIKKNPGSLPIIGTPTGNTGSYSYSNLENGTYELFVDIPGLNMACTYSFTINGATTINGFDFAAGSTSVHPTSTVNATYNSCNNVVATGIKSFNSTQQNNLQVYPNPYQGHTNIVLNLETNDVITLEVYNSLGQKVTTLDSGNKQAGKYQYDFSARQLNFASGLYFLKLKTNHQQQVIKLIEQ